MVGSFILGISQPNIISTGIFSNIQQTAMHMLHQIILQFYPED